MEIYNLPCKIKNIAFRAGAGDGLNFRYHDSNYSIGNGLALSVETDDTAPVVRLWDSPDCCITYYKFRGGLAGFSMSDIAFLVIDGTGSVKVGGKNITYASGDILDMTQKSGNFVFEAPSETRLLKVEFNS